MMDDKRMENLPEEDGLRPEPLTLRGKFIIGALIAVSALWGILLWKLAGWLVWGVKSLW